jgi:hypothetical protein
MNPGIRRAVLGFFAAFVAVGVHAAMPPWLKSASAIPTPENIGSAPAVVLMDDSRLEIDETGTMVETRRFALRVLHDAGRRYAEASAVYNGASSKVEELTTWVVRNGKVFEEKATSQWVDVSAGSAGAVIDEIRMRRYDFSGRALNGDVFAFETRIRMPMTVAQLFIEFGGLLPKVSETYNLILPPGFNVTTLARGAGEIESAHPDPRQWTWKMSNQGYRPEEPNESNMGRVDAELLVQIEPPATAAKFRPGRFAAWSDVTALSDSLNRPQCDTNPALASQARNLAAGSPDKLTTIKRISGYVQQTRYIAINRGLRHGYGWRARKATEVLATGFGDCKDKANLMVAMLRELGIPAHMVIARLDRDREISQEFPSPIQFNHAIVAIPVDEAIDLPTVVPVEGLGRVLFFDPTDPFTQVGDISGTLQGSRVFVLAPGVNGLVDLPKFSPGQDFRTERRVELELAANGGLAMSGEIAGSRQAAVRMRAAFKEATKSDELDALITRQLGSRVKGASVVSKKVDDDRAADRCTLAFVCTIPGYMQLSNSATPVIRLDVLGRANVPNLTEPQRRLPVEVHPLELADDIKLNLPAGFAAAEVPKKVALESQYGRFNVEYLVEPGSVRMKRTLVLERAVVPVTDYPKLKQFLADVARSDRSSVLLRREIAAQ